MEKNQKISSSPTQDYGLGESSKTNLDESPIITKILPTAHTLATYSCTSTASQRPIKSIKGTSIPLVSHQSFYDLLTFDTPIDDSIIDSFLHVLKTFIPHISYVDTIFSTELSKKGWDFSFCIYFQHTNSSWYAHTTKWKPTLDDTNINIPIYISSCPWVALVRRVINEAIFFLYSDDMNSSSTFETVKHIFSTKTSSQFHQMMLCGLTVKQKHITPILMNVARNCYVH